MSHRRILITADLGIADLRRFSAGFESGVILARFPRVIPTARLNAALVTAIREIRPENFAGSIVVVAPRRVRFRRPG